MGELSKNSSAIDRRDEDAVALSIFLSFQSHVCVLSITAIHFSRHRARQVEQLITLAGRIQPISVQLHTN